MIFSKITRFFRKKDSTLSNLYIEQIQTAETAAKLLYDLVISPEYEERKRISKEIKKCESKGDILSEQIFETLFTMRNTVYSRENLQILASRIETFLDLIHDSAKKVVIYQPLSIDSVLGEIAAAIMEDAKIISGLLPELGNLESTSESLLSKCLRIKEIEHEVDDLYECYMSNLFQVEKDAIELTKNKNIVQSLEDTTDCAKEISDCIKTMIVKARP